MFCKYCGQKIDEDSVFCRFCGGRILSDVAANIEGSTFNKEFKFGSREELLKYVQLCGDKYRTGEKSDSCYRAIIDKHIEHKDIGFLLDNVGFLELIYQTLIYWNMNQRRAKLKPFEEIKQSVIKYRDEILSLYPYRIEELDEKQLKTVLEKLKYLFINLRPMQSSRQIVGTSKLLHFLLPNLVMPIDGKFTMEFFYGYNKCGKDINEEFNYFEDIYIKFYEIIKQFNVCKEDAKNNNLQTSVPKTIDNAIIGIQLYK